MEERIILTSELDELKHTIDSEQGERDFAYDYIKGQINKESS